MSQTLLDKLPEPLGKMYYLASPYSHPDALVREVRYLAVDAAAAHLYMLGFCLIEPIGSSHPKAKSFELPKGYEFWKERDRLFIQKSDGVIVLCLPGWEASVGVTDEIEYAKALGKSVYYLDPEDLFVGDSLKYVR